MRYKEFEKIISLPRIGRYLVAVSGNTRNAMTLYRLNLALSQELFTIESCFEVTLRNKIDQHYTATLGNDWLRDSVQPGGMFTNPNCGKTQAIVTSALGKVNPYLHEKVVPELTFGFWRYLFANHQYRVGGQTLIAIFPNIPRSTPALRYDRNYIFNKLKQINEFRDRLAHHEPMCFDLRGKSTLYPRHLYSAIIRFFQWMDIDENDLLYGLDHVDKVCNRIDAL